MRYDKIIAVDWSARSKPSPRKPTKDAIFMCVAGQHPTYHRTRFAAMETITGYLDQALAAGEKVLIGFDFSFGYPSDFAERLTESTEGLAVWKWLAEHIEDDETNANNRFDVAKKMNAMFDGIGPFWGCPSAVADGDLPAKGSHRHGHDMTERRVVEQTIPKAQSTWKLFTTGSVGSQSLLGLPHLWALKQRYGDDLKVWPLETGFAQPDANITLVEIYPSLTAMGYMIPLQVEFPKERYEIVDAGQVRAVCDLFETANEPDTWSKIFAAAVDDVNADAIAQEGWILGAGQTP